MMTRARSRRRMTGSRCRWSSFATAGALSGAGQVHFRKADESGGERFADFRCSCNEQMTGGDRPASFD
jgi:hypothetical protein